MTPAEASTYYDNRPSTEPLNADEEVLLHRLMTMHVLACARVGVEPAPDRMRALLHISSAALAQMHDEALAELDAVLGDDGGLH